MDPQSAARLVSALDAELGRRWKRRRDTAEAAWRAESDADPELLAARQAYERAQAAVDAAQGAVDEAEAEDAAPAEAELAKAEAALAAAQRGLSAARSSSQVWRSVLVLARSLEWHADNPPPAGAVAEPTDQSAQDERERVRSRIDERGGLDSVLREITRKAERLCDQEEREADPTIPKRRVVIIGPRHQSISGLARDPAAGSAKSKTLDGDGKSAKMSRTDKWREQQAARLLRAKPYCRRVRRNRRNKRLAGIVASCRASTSGLRSVLSGFPGWLALPRLRLLLVPFVVPG
jgi:hypothetical protein